MSGLVFSLSRQCLLWLLRFLSTRVVIVSHANRMTMDLENGFDLLPFF